MPCFQLFTAVHIVTMTEVSERPACVLVKKKNKIEHFFGPLVLERSAESCPLGISCFQSHDRYCEHFLKKSIFCSRLTFVIYWAHP